MALSAGQTDVILATGDHECAWAEVRPADRALIAAAPELLSAVDDLVQIVEGVRSERWACEGRRLKDTPEWCILYSIRAALMREMQNTEGSERPAPGAR
jgi:hypothetical protein